MIDTSQHESEEEKQQVSFTIAKPRERSPHSIEATVFQKKMVTDMYSSIKEETEEELKAQQEDELSDKSD